MNNQKELSIEDFIIYLNKSKDCYKDDDGYVYIVFNETVLDVKKFTYCIFDCKNCSNYDCIANF